MTYLYLLCVVESQIALELKRERCVEVGCHDIGRHAVARLRRLLARRDGVEAGILFKSMFPRQLISEGPPPPASPEEVKRSLSEGLETIPTSYAENSGFVKWVRSLPPSSRALRGGSVSFSLEVAVQGTYTMGGLDI